MKFSAASAPPSRGQLFCAMRDSPLAFEDDVIPISEPTKIRPAAASDQEPVYRRRDCSSLSVNRSAAIWGEDDHGHNGILGQSAQVHRAHFFRWP